MATQRTDNGRGARRRLRRKRPLRGRANPQGREARSQDQKREARRGRQTLRRKQPTRMPSRGTKAAAPRQPVHRPQGDARQLALAKLGIQDGEQLRQFTQQTVGAIQARDQRLGRPVYGTAGPVAGGVPGGNPYSSGPVLSPEYQRPEDRGAPLVASPPQRSSGRPKQEQFARQRDDMLSEAQAGTGPPQEELARGRTAGGTVTMEQGVPQAVVPSPPPVALTREQLAASAAQGGRLMLDPSTGAVVGQDPALARGAMPPEAQEQAGLTRVPPVAGVIGLDPAPPQPVDTDQQLVLNEQGAVVAQPIATSAVEQVAPVQPTAAAQASAPTQPAVAQAPQAAAPVGAAPVAATPQAAPVAGGVPAAPVASAPVAAAPASNVAAPPPGLRRRRLPLAAR